MNFLLVTHYNGLLPVCLRHDVTHNVQKKRNSIYKNQQAF